jgi:hypothetical protein
VSDLRYPIGRFSPPSEYTSELRLQLIRALEDAPAQLRQAVSGLTREQLETPYREGGWTVAQVAHHLPDSHLHAYIRLKYALTEDNPTIKPYNESDWARLPDASSPDSIELSLQLLESLHGRFVASWRGMDAAQWARPFQHPDRGPMTLDRTLAL